jgi:hypothetical protein
VSGVPSRLLAANLARWHAHERQSVGPGPGTLDVAAKRCRTDGTPSYEKSAHWMEEEGAHLYRDL